VFGSRERDELVQQLNAARERIEELSARLAKLTSHDPVTEDVYTLRAFRTQLELEVPRARRYSHPLSVVAIDIDNFRKFNLKHGYAAGDRLLAAFGSVIAGATRAHDIACRIGNDEFALLLPETPAEGAAVVANRILSALEDLEVEGVRGHAASMGVTALGPGQGPEELLDCAGAALQEARAAGGAQTCLRVSPAASLLPADLPAAHADVIAALASTLGERDRYTGDHSESVVELAERVGEALALEADALARLRTAALLHDVGKVGVPDQILHKPGPLDEHEWAVMREHPVIGERIMRAIPGMGAVARIIRHEHERWDGQGYPDGIAGAAIPIEARIILACDAYHAMTSDRPYRKAMPHADAVAQLSANAGAQFDPEVVEALVGYLFGRRQSGLAAV
jgi:diguanylate cyclase (GGDEF)-like protein